MNRWAASWQSVRTAWDDHALADLLSLERLRSYFTATHTESEALRLYEWNCRAAAVAMQTVAMVEVIVRNGLDRELVDWSTLQAPGLSSFGQDLEQQLSAHADPRPLDSRI